jgi:hypothetical protein
MVELEIGPIDLLDLEFDARFVSAATPAPLEAAA